MSAQAGQPTLDELRAQIDACDREIVRLLNVRMGVCEAIGRAKDASSDAASSGEQQDVYQPAREKAVFEKVTRLNQEQQGALTDKAVCAVYREIMSASISLQRRTTVAFLGPPATFTHQAAVSRFGASIAFRPYETIADVFTAVKSGEANYGVVPVENSTEGSVTYTLDELAALGDAARIYAEIVMPIQQDLLSRCASVGQIRRVYSHPQALAQCRRWLRENLPDAELVSASSTARAAQTAAEEEGAAAVASPLASSVYNVPVAVPAVQDLANNQSRFIVLGQKGDRPTGKDKTFVMMSLKDRPGALHDALAVFRAAEVNLLKIESRPSRQRQWEYHFFIDVEGHENDETVRKAIAGLADHCSTVQVLGSCPNARA